MYHFVSYLAMLSAKLRNSADSNGGSKGFCLTRWKVIIVIRYPTKSHEIINPWNKNSFQFKFTILVQFLWMNIRSDKIRDRCHEQLTFCRSVVYLIASKYFQRNRETLKRHQYDIFYMPHGLSSLFHIKCNFILWTSWAANCKLHTTSSWWWNLFANDYSFFFRKNYTN